ncbi:BTAD domain-containing putative transcriptional regulator [Nocardiopsis sp. NPDC007018]|uniref:AfsR/SARP family transcriptional regulator n=1 Tax=Nocardiopsis sp. NPDC007018 TaxID=3155721 RepID=UPI0033C73404
MYAGREVTFDQLIGYLWSDDPPRTARSVIQVQISHLRRAFPGTISTTSGGYLADVDPDRIDLHRFRRLREAADPAEPEAALTLLAEALECWRGVPFSGVGSEHLYYSVVSPLLEERWAAVADWATYAVSLGRASEAVSYLTPIVREEPLRERLHHLFVTALWHSGERAAALSAYEEIRSRLADELGVDPDPDLTALHTRILRADTVEQTPPKGLPSTLPPVKDQFVVRNDLPRDTPDFAGRRETLAHLVGVGASEDDRARVCVISGSGGSGKTTLAVRAGHELVDLFPDGQLFIDLYGYTADKRPLDEGTALGALLRAVGVPVEDLPDSVDERSALWRATLRGRRLLVVLDNAVSYAQVNPILPSAEGTLTLVTTRNDLGGLGGTDYVSLGMLGEESALELLGNVLGEERVLKEREQALRVARICGGLPLALRVVAGRMLSRPKWSFGHVERRLSEQSRRFRELQMDGQNVEAAIDLSYRSLDPAQRRAFLLLGVLIGTTVDLHGASALLDLEPEDADDLLQGLVGVCLLEEPAGDVYRLHDLIGDFSRYRGTSDLDPVEVGAARGRLAEQYMTVSQRAADLLGPRAHGSRDEAGGSRYRTELLDRAEAEAWFDLHQDNIADVIDFYSDGESVEEAWVMAEAVWRFYAQRGRMGHLLTSQEKALRASERRGSQRGRAVTLIGMGIAHCLSGRFESALSFLREAHGLLEDLGDERGIIRALANLGMVYERMGWFGEAAKCVEGVLDHALSQGDKQLEVMQRGNLAMLYQNLGRHREALSLAQGLLGSGVDERQENSGLQAMLVVGEARTALGELEGAYEALRTTVELARGKSMKEMYAHNSLGVAYRAGGRFAEAVTEHRTALELADRSGNRSADSEILTDLGMTHAAAGEHAKAGRTLEKALANARERGERYVEARASLALGRLPAPDMDAARARELLTDALRIFEELGLPEVERAREALKDL